MNQYKNIIDIASIATPCTFEENDLIKKILIKNNLEVNFLMKIKFQLINRKTIISLALTLMKGF